MAGALLVADSKAKKSEQREQREYTTFRCYVEQGELLNDLARAEKCTIADVIERHFHDALKAAAVKAHKEKIKQLES